MKIDAYNPYASQLYNTIANQHPVSTHNGAAADSESTGMTATDSITISGATILVGISSLSQDAVPMFDKLRVAELKRSVHTNNYPINTERTAEKLHQFFIRLH